MCGYKNVYYKYSIINLLTTPTLIPNFQEVKAIEI